MPADDLVQRLMEAHHVERKREPQRERFVVERVARRQLVQEVQTLLGKGRPVRTGGLLPVEALAAVIVEALLPQQCLEQLALRRRKVERLFAAFDQLALLGWFMDPSMSTAACS